MTLMIILSLGFIYMYTHYVKNINAIAINYLLPIIELWISEQKIISFKTVHFKINIWKEAYSFMQIEL